MFCQYGTNLDLAAVETDKAYKHLLKVENELESRLENERLWAVQKIKEKYQDAVLSLRVERSWHLNECESCRDVQQELSKSQPAQSW